MTATPPRKGARNELTLQDKISLINKSTGKSHRQLADMFHVGKTQVGSILKNKRKFLDAFENNEPASRKRQAFSSTYDEVDKVTWEWFQRKRSMMLPISGPMLQEQARKFSCQLNLTDFKASNGWLQRFKGRHNIGGAVLSGERGSVDGATVDDWQQRLPGMIAGYEPRNIFNMDETGVVYRVKDG